MTANEKKIIDELKAVPITDKTREEIRWNIAEQQFLIRLINLRDEAAKEEMFAAIAEVVAAQNRMMFTELGEQTKLLTAMSLDISGIKLQLKLDEHILKLLETRLDAKKLRIESLEGDVKILKQDIGYIKGKIKSKEPNKAK